MAQTLSPDQLERLLISAEFNMSKVAWELGITPERVRQLCKSLGVKIVKGIERVEPGKKSLLYADRTKDKP